MFVSSIRVAYFAAAVAVVCALPSAQNHVAVPTDTLHGRQGQTVPLGSVPSNTFDEARAQFLIPARYLPSTPDDIVSVEVAAQLPGVVHYRSLQVGVGHARSDTLSPVFANNWANPMTVANLQNTSLSFAPNGWTRILFSTPFRHDGRRGVVIEFRKVLSTAQLRSPVSHQTSFGPDRGDLPVPVFASGPTASTASSARLGFPQLPSSRLMLRLRFRVAPTLAITGVAPTPSRDSFHLGSKLTLTVYAAPRNLFVIFFDSGHRSVPLSFLGFNGGMYLNRPLLWLGGPVDTNGVGRASLAIPAIPLLVGIPFVFQAVRLGSTIDFTNVVDAIVAP